MSVIPKSTVDLKNFSKPEVRKDEILNEEGCETHFLSQNIFGHVAVKWSFVQWQVVSIPT